MKYPFNMGSTGYYANSKARCPFRIGKTLSQPPERWSLTNETREKLFAALATWFVEWERKHKVGLDPKTGEEQWVVKPHHFIRCSRCKMNSETTMHLVETPATKEIAGPFCTQCVDLVLARQFTGESGETLDLTLFTINTKAKDLDPILEVIKQMKKTAEVPPKDDDTEIDSNNLF